jgi:CubicO group peptidase (beta-lactamase class C family)
MKRLILLIQLLLIMFIGTSLKAQINTKTNLTFVDKVPQWLVENKVPVVGIGIIENGKLKYIKVFGELQKNVPAPKNTIFEIASMIKPVVATVILKLVEAGQWNLDEPLAKYWIDPDLLDDTLLNKLTIRHVLTHQTGFPNWRNGKLRFEFEPGTKFQYSGEGFEYLRKALENKFKKTLVQLSDSILFKPLGMKDTRYFFDKDMDTTLYAIPHDGQGNKIEISIKDRGVNAAGLLLTTIEDYSKFMIYVMNGAGLSPSLFNDMILSQAAERKHVGRGLGWEIVSDLPNGEYSIQHVGSSMGVKTMGIILPKSKRGFVVFTNGENGITVYNEVIKESLDEGQQILDFTNGNINRAIVKLSNEILDQYIGSYARSDQKGWTINIIKIGDILKLSGESLPTVDFLPYAEDKFFVKGFGFQCEFIRDEMNKVIKINISENGKLLLDAKKIK